MSSCTCKNCEDGEPVYQPPSSTAGLFTQTAAGWESDVNSAIRIIQPHVKRMSQIRIVIEKLKAQKSKFSETYRTAESGSAKEKRAEERLELCDKRISAWEGRKVVIFKAIKDYLSSLVKYTIEWACTAAQESSAIELLARKFETGCDLTKQSSGQLARGLINFYTSGEPLDKLRLDYSMGDFKGTSESL